MDQTLVGWGTEQGSIRFDDAVLRIEVRALPSPMLATDAKEHDAWRVSYTFAPEGRQPAVLLEEWLRVSDSQPVAVANNFQASVDGKAVRETRFGRLDRVPLLHAPAVWERALPAEDGWVLPYPAERFAPGLQTDDGELQFHASVVACAHVLEVGMTSPAVNGAAYLPDEVATLTFQANSSWPSSIRVHEASGPDAPSLEMRLLSFRPGMGPELSPFRPLSARPIRGIQTVSVADNLDGADPHPTSLREAVSATQDSPTARLWFLQQPAPQLIYLTHRLGTGTVVDQWELGWQGQATGWLSVVTREQDALGIQPLKVMGGETSHYGYDGDGRMASLPDIYSVHERFYGTPAESVLCDLVADYCRVGAHALNNDPYAGGVGGGTVLAGLLVEQSTGLLLQEASLQGKASPSPGS